MMEFAHAVLCQAPGESFLREMKNVLNSVGQNVSNP